MDRTGAAPPLTTSPSLVLRAPPLPPPIKASQKKPRGPLQVSHKALRTVAAQNTVQKHYWRMFCGSERVDCWGRRSGKIQCLLSLRYPASCCTYARMHATKTKLIIAAEQLMRAGFIVRRQVPVGAQQPLAVCSAAARACAAGREGPRHQRRAGHRVAAAGGHHAAAARRRGGSPHAGARPCHCSLHPNRK